MEVSQEGVRRVFSPASEVDLMVARDRRWRAGVSKAGAFAPFCPCVLLMPTAPRTLRSRLWEADFWGIGSEPSTTSRKSFPRPRGIGASSS